MTKEEMLQNISDENYHFIEGVLTKFKNQETGYSEAIYCITEKYEQVISQKLDEYRKEIRKQVVPKKDDFKDCICRDNHFARVGFNRCIDEINSNFDKLK